MTDAQRIERLENAVIELSQNLISFQQFVLSEMEKDIEHGKKMRTYNKKLTQIQENHIEMMKDILKR